MPSSIAPTRLHCYDAGKFIRDWRSGGMTMAKEVLCPCGEVLRGDNDNELVVAVMSHAQDHGHDVSEADRETILSTAYEV